MMYPITHRLAGILLVLGLAAACTSGSSTGGSTSNLSSSKIYSGLTGQGLLYDGEGNSGAFVRAMNDSIFADFQAKTGMTVTNDTGGGGVTKLAGMEDSGNVTWTVVQYSTITDWKEAEAQNLLLPLDTSIVPVDQLVQSSYDTYGYQFVPYAAAVAWNTNDFPLSGKHPTTIEDVFNTTDFPGRRCLFKYPQFGGTLEAAALASGVSPDHLYPLDVARALKELDKIKSNTLFWSDSAQAIQALLSGSCSIGIMWEGPLRDAILQNPTAPIGRAYGHAIKTAGSLEIPKGTKNLQAAEALLRFVIEDRTGEEKLLNETGYFGVNYKTPLTVPDNLKPYILSPENSTTVITEDDYWYLRNIDNVIKTFNLWLVS